MSDEGLYFVMKGSNEAEMQRTQSLMARCKLRLPSDKMTFIRAKWLEPWCSWHNEFNPIAGKCYSLDRCYRYTPGYMSYDTSLLDSVEKELIASDPKYPVCIYAETHEKCISGYYPGFTFKQDGDLYCASFGEYLISFGLKYLEADGEVIFGKED